MCNRDNAHNVGIFPDEIKKRSEPTNQVQTTINIVKSLQTYLILKNYLTTYQEFKIHLVIFKILGKY